MNRTIPFFNPWMLANPTLPKLYWEVKSPEQLVANLYCIINSLKDYFNSITDQVNLHTLKIEELEELTKKFIESGFVDYYEQQLSEWLSEHTEEIVAAATYQYTQIQNSFREKIYTIDHANVGFRYDVLTDEIGTSPQGNCVFSPSENYDFDSQDLAYAVAFGTDEKRKCIILDKNGKLKGSCAMGSGHYGNLSYANGYVFGVNYTGGSENFGFLTVINVSDQSNPFIEGLYKINGDYGLEYNCAFDGKTMLVGTYKNDNTLDLYKWNFKTDVYEKFVTLKNFRSGAPYNGSNINYDSHTNTITYCGYAPNTIVIYDAKTGDLLRYINVNNQYSNVCTGEIEACQVIKDNLWFGGYTKQIIGSLVQFNAFNFNVKTGAQNTKYSNNYGNQIADITLDPKATNASSGKYNKPIFKYATDMVNFIKNVTPSCIAQVKITLANDLDYMLELMDIPVEIAITNTNDAKFNAGIRLMNVNVQFLNSNNLFPSDPSKLQTYVDKKYYIRAIASNITIGKLAPTQDVYTVVAERCQIRNTNELSKCRTLLSTVNGLKLSDSKIENTTIFETQMYNIDADSTSHIYGTALNKTSSTTFNYEELHATKFPVMRMAILMLCNESGVIVASAPLSTILASSNMYSMYGESKIVSRTVSISDGIITVTKNDTDTSTLNNYKLQFI